MFLRGWTENFINENIWIQVSSLWKSFWPMTEGMPNVKALQTIEKIMCGRNETARWPATALSVIFCDS